MLKILILFFSFSIVPILLSQSITVGNGTCELPVFEDWSTGSGANPCACRWIDHSLNYYVCSFGNCGSLEFNECNSTDCAGGQPFPSGWYQGGGNFGSTMCLIILPVELSYFKGTSSDAKIELAWQTLNERNCSHFEIYHSENGVEFEALTTMDAVGNSTEVNNYLFFHQKAPIGINYYKLKIVDINGEFEETNVVAVDNRPATGNKLFSSLYPNPAYEFIKFMYLGNKSDQPIHVEIISSTGEVLYNETHLLSVSTDEITVNLETLSPGVYSVRINQQEQSEIKRLVIQR